MTAPELTRAELLDCHGRVTHTLVLLVDGNVEIRFPSGIVAKVDPGRRANLTPAITISSALMDAAGALRP